MPRPPGAQQPPIGESDARARVSSEAEMSRRVVRVVATGMQRLLTVGAALRPRRFNRGTLERSACSTSYRVVHADAECIGHPTHPSAARPEAIAGPAAGFEAPNAYGPQTTQPLKPWHSS